MLHKILGITAVSLLCWSVTTASFEITVDGTNGATSGTWIPDADGYVRNSFVFNVSNTVVLSAADSATSASVSAYSAKGQKVCAGTVDTAVSCSSGSADEEESCDIEAFAACVMNIGGEFNIASCAQQFPECTDSEPDLNQQGA